MPTIKQLHTHVHAQHTHVYVHVCYCTVPTRRLVNVSRYTVFTAELNGKNLTHKMFSTANNKNVRIQADGIVSFLEHFHDRLSPNLLATQVIGCIHVQLYKLHPHVVFRVQLQ